MLLTRTENVILFEQIHFYFCVTTHKPVFTTNGSQSTTCKHLDWTLKQILIGKLVLFY